MLLDQPSATAAATTPPSGSPVPEPRPGPLSITDVLTQLGVSGGVTLGGAGPDEAGEAAAASAAIRSLRGRYTVGGVVAQGGMGAILSARDLNVRRQVAMKVMLDQGGAVGDQVLRFIEEAQVTGQLEHPGVVPVHELGVDADGKVYYTMKMVRGTTLREIVARLADGDPDALARYPLSRLLTLFQRVADAVAFAHSRGVIHRDLKPENVMVGNFGEVYVMDWGLAKLVGRDEGRGARGEGAEAEGGGWKVEGRQTTDHGPRTPAPGPRTLCPNAVESVRQDGIADAELTLDGTVMGTPAFMAPEQALGRIAELDARTDVYALGAILYNLLALRPPVEGATVQELLAKVTAGEITPPEALRGQGSGLRAQGKKASRPSTLGPPPSVFPHCPGGEVPAALAAVAMKALSLRPADRYPSVKELQAEIERYQAGFATAAEHAGLWRQLVLLVQRHRREFSLAAAALLLVVVLVAGFVIRLGVEKARAVAGEQRADANAKQAVVARDEALVARTEAETRRDQAEYASYQALIGLAQGHLDKGDDVKARAALTSCPRRFRHWEWGFLGCQCRRIEESTEPARSLLQVAMSLDGKRVAWQGYEGIVVEAVGSGERKVIGPTADGVRSLQFTPDGESIVVLTTGFNVTEGVLELYRIDTGERLWQTKLPAGANARVVVSPTEPYAVAGGGPYKALQSSLVDLRTGAVVRTLGQPGEYTRAAVWAPDGKGVWRLDANGLCLHDMQTGTVVKRIAVAAQWLAVSPDGQRLATAGGTTVRLWDATSGAQVALFWHSGEVNALLFAAGGRILLGGGADGVLCAWDAASGQPMGTMRGRAVTSLAGVPGSEVIYVGHSTNRLRRTSLPEITGRGLTERLNRLGVTPGAGGLAFSRAGDHLLYAPNNAFVLITPDATSAARFVRQTVLFPWSLAWDGDDTSPVATAYNTGDVRVWDLGAGKVVHEFRGDRHAHAGAVVCWIEPGKLLAAGGQVAGEVNLYDVQSGQLLRRLDTGTQPVLALALSPDRRTLYVGGDGGLTTFDVATWLPVAPLLSPRASSVYGIAFSPNGEWLAVSGWLGDGWCTSLWRPGQPEAHACVEGVQGPRLAFTADGKRLAVASGKGAITLIDTERGAALLTLNDHGSGDVYGLAFSPDSRRLASSAASLTQPLLSREADPWEE